VTPRTFADADEQAAFSLAWFGIWLCFSLFFGIKGSELTAKNYRPSNPIRVTRRAGG
jgi:hypothetical protein